MNLPRLTLRHLSLILLDYFRDCRSYPHFNSHIDRLMPLRLTDCLRRERREKEREGRAEVFDFVFFFEIEARNSIYPCGEGGGVINFESLRLPNTDLISGNGTHNYVSLVFSIRRMLLKPSAAAPSNETRIAQAPVAERLGRAPACQAMELQMWITIFALTFAAAIIFSLASYMMLHRSSPKIAGYFHRGRIL